MRANRTSRSAVAAGVLATGALIGCSQNHGTSMSGRPDRAVAATGDPRTLAMFDGRTGAAIAWQQLLDAVDQADAVIIGEQHDDAMGHAVEGAIVADMMRLHKGTALCLEMLERDDQILVDDYLDGIIDADQLARLTFSTSWAGPEGSWKVWYQPLIDSAKDAGSPVVAANAPRRYVRLARKDGYDRLDALPPARRALAAHPATLPEGAYRERFYALMSESNEGGEKHDGSSGHTMTPEELEAMFRSQTVWDATMADSIAGVLDRGAGKAVHVVGQFHSDFEGGTVVELRARKPGVRILVISMQKRDGRVFDPEDKDRAGVIIYTGKR